MTTPPARAAGVPGRHQRPRRRAGWPPAHWLVPLALAVGTVIFHLAMVGTVPTGPDPGNWLAMARERLGQEVMSAEGFYPPVFPYTLAGLLLVLEPVNAVLVAGLAAKVAVTLAVFYCARSLGPLFAGLAAFVVGVSGAQLEAYAWGAYPQFMATAFALVSVLAFLRYLVDRTGGWLALGIGSGLLTFGTHLLVGGLYVFALPISVLVWLRLSRASRAESLRAILFTAPVLLPGGVYLLAAAFAIRNDGFQPAINPLGLDRVVAVTHALRDTPLLWVVLVLVAGYGMAHPAAGPARKVLRAWSAGWILAGSVFFLLTGEARSLLLTQVAVVVMAAAGFAEIVRRAAAADRATGQMSLVKSRLPWIAIAAVTIISGIVAGGINEYVGAAGWFRVVDRPETDALEVLDDWADPGDLAFAASGNNGHPLGWWSEGLAGVPTYSATDVRWLSFPEERDQAGLLNEIFSGVMPGARARERLTELGVDFIVIDRRSADAGWLDGELARSMRLIYNSPTIVLLEFGG